MKPALTTTRFRPRVPRPRPTVPSPKSQVPSPLSLVLLLLALSLSAFSLQPSGFCSDAPRPNTLSSLSFFNAGHPRIFQFRHAENSALKKPYDEWKKDHAQFHGILGKALDEEMLGRAQVLSHFTRFKKDHPDKFVLLHYNGRAINPNAPASLMAPFSAAHWLYYVGCKSTADIPAQPADTEIPVEDTTRFRTHPKSIWHDDIVIYRLNDDGTPDWEHSEQVVLRSINAKKSTITVARGKYHTTPRAFAAGKAMLRAHASVYPASGNQPLRWYYNLSTRSPRDKNGRQAAEVWANQMADMFAPGGPLEYFDGVQFDVAFSRIEYDNIVLRGIDADCDNTPDTAWLDGINTYALGSQQFFETLRRRLGPNRIIQADGMWESHQRAFNVINGIESEGFQSLTLKKFEWSDAMNRHRIWDKFAHPPAFSYVVNKYTVPNDNRAIDRVAMAGAQMTDAAITFSLNIRKDFNHADPGAADEMVNGVERKQGWLGKPLAPAVNLARNTPDLLNGAGKQFTAAFLPRCVPPPATGETIPADANAYVSKNNPSANYSFTERMNINSHERAYFRFDTSALAQTPEKILLKLYITLTSAGEREHTINFHLVKNADWKEDGITLENAPPHAPAPIASVKLNKTKINTWLELDVTKHLKQPGKHTICVENTTTTRYGFASRTHSDEIIRPHLRVYYSTTAATTSALPSTSGRGAGGEGLPQANTPTATLSTENGTLKATGNQNGKVVSSYSPGLPERSEGYPGYQNNNQNGKAVSSYSPGLPERSEGYPGYHTNNNTNLEEVASHPTMRIHIRDIPVHGPDLTIFATFKSDPMPNYPKAFGRAVYARVIEEDGTPSKTSFTFSHTQPFESVFYFENIKSTKVTLEFRVEGTDDIHISNLTAHASPDLMYREFEYGLVLINPDMTKPATFNLEALFPGKTFHRIQGPQTPDINTGTRAKSATLPPYDALFLRKN